MLDHNLILQPVFVNITYDKEELLNERGFPFYIYQPPRLLDENEDFQLISREDKEKKQHYLVMRMNYTRRYEPMPKSIKTVKGAIRYFWKRYPSWQYGNLINCYSNQGCHSSKYPDPKPRLFNLKQI
ncbi:hypothetical protein OAQ99_04690 [Candidatus Kapabacteria bacterium]|nr:hypothetical protein [Candidatus Kapabacteria bacterium]